MEITDTTITQTDATSSKRPRVSDSTSPDTRDSLIQDLPGNKCPHCKKPCTRKSEALQCDLCAAWVHARCEGVTSELYKSLNLVFSKVSNLSYYCEANRCYSRNKQLIHDYFKKMDQDLNIPSLRSLQAEQASFHESITNMSTKIDDLSSQNSNLQNKVQDASELILVNRVSTVESKLNDLKQELAAQISKYHETFTSKDKSPEPPTAIANTIVNTLNEEKERERRRLNLIIHNAPESAAQDAESRKTEDIECVTDIFNVFLGANATVTKAIRIGKKPDKNSNKSRLMKVTVDTLEAKTFILRNCTKLRNAGESTYYNKIYITPDLMPSEQEANCQLRAKLNDMNKEGRQYRIKNGKIVSRVD